LASGFTTRVESIERCAADVVLVRLARPEAYTSRAGQWFRLTLDTAEGVETKTFTNAAAPSDGWLEIATRISGSAFKARLERLGVGDEVAIVGPGGRLSLAPEERRVAFLVGGVGITPARSILRDATQHRRSFDDALVVYGSRDTTCIPYLEELHAMSSAGVRVVTVLEHPPTGWHGERGFVTAELVDRHGDICDGRPVFVSGPPPMVEAMQSVLDELGVEPGRRRIEWFGAPTRRGLG
jgi:ferredoxin-NADP reductase